MRRGKIPVAESTESRDPSGRDLKQVPALSAERYERSSPDRFPILLPSNCRRIAGNEGFEGAVYNRAGFGARTSWGDGRSWSISGASATTGSSRSHRNQTTWKVPNGLIAITL